jgi:hypothetical protein
MKQVLPHDKDLGGGFVVRRLLPAVQARSVGPFVFFDHFGPIRVRPEDNHDVRPHPHIGLATFTYLYEGALMHRDSTGAVQRIEPGAVNLMTAGRGVVHSERTPDDLRGVARVSHGLQLWLALPTADEDMEPAFAHTPVDAIPELEVGGARLRVAAGEVFGVASPVATRSPTLMVDVAMSAGDAFPMPPGTERAVYPVSGRCTLDGVALEPLRLYVLDAGSEPLLAAEDEARVALIGGEPLGTRHLWWNFVSSRKERLQQAAEDWAAQRFPAVPGEQEFIPSPAFKPAG